LQRANATVQQGHASYNAGWAQNSARQSAAVANYTNQAIHGVSPMLTATVSGPCCRTRCPRGRPVSRVATPTRRTPRAPTGAGRATVGRGWMRHANEAAAQFTFY
jgi:poly(3-hydroxybutyrate) depolymerase